MIKLQVLLRKPWRNPEGIAKVRSLMQDLGITTTASGAASISAEVDPALVESIFGAKLGPREAQRTTAVREFPLPDSLREYAESITVAPRHIVYSAEHHRDTT